MKIILDTSIIVEIDRRNKSVIEMIKQLIESDSTVIISTITISEILTGSYLASDFKKAVSSAKRILGQFSWIDFDSEIAEKTAKYMSYLISKGNIIDYEDVAIAATCSVTYSDFLITLNNKHFKFIPELKGKVLLPEEANKMFN